MPDYLQHYGIRGQKWGVRRFQNEDGSYTNEGKERYHRGKEYSNERAKKRSEEYARLIENSKQLKKTGERSRSLA